MLVYVRLQKEKCILAPLAHILYRWPKCVHKQVFILARAAVLICSLAAGNIFRAMLLGYLSVRKKNERQRENTTHFWRCCGNCPRDDSLAGRKDVLLKRLPNLYLEWQELCIAHEKVRAIYREVSFCGERVGAGGAINKTGPDGFSPPDLLDDLDRKRTRFCFRSSTRPLVSWERMCSNCWRRTEKRERAAAGVTICCRMLGNQFPATLSSG